MFLSLCIVSMKWYNYVYWARRLSILSCVSAKKCRASASEREWWCQSADQRQWTCAHRAWAPIGFRSRFSQCVDYMRFNEKSFCFRWQETTKLMLFGNTKTSSLVILCDLRYLTGNISSVMTKHTGVQRKLHRFAYLIVQIILWF